MARRLRSWADPKKPRKPRARPRQLEHAEQVVVVHWLRLAKILHCAIPNGGYALSPQAGKRMVDAGLSTGAPDLLIFDPPPTCPGNKGTAVEMKRVGGDKPTPEQCAWHEALAARGWVVVVAYGAAEALRELARLGYRVPG
jgi:hypothetical protein